MATKGAAIPDHAISDLTKKVGNALLQRGWVLSQDVGFSVQVSVSQYREGNKFARFMAGFSTGAGLALVEGDVTVLNKDLILAKAMIRKRTGPSFLQSSLYEEISDVENRFAEAVADFITGKK